MMPPNTSSTVIVFLISNSLFPQRKKTENKYLECSILNIDSTNKGFFLVSKVEREAMGSLMERENIESGRSEGAKKESRRRKGNVC